LIARRKWHRGVFFAAGIYNIVWGIFSSLDPQWMFKFAHMPLQNYPEIFACLGMVLALYGVLYLYVARFPEDGFIIALVGLTGKILGPIGWISFVLSGHWPLSTIILCLTNDLIWWIPLALYIFDAWPSFQNKLRTGGI
jgi:hypothetical protein